MSLQPGTKLAHYEILEPIGKGGMGEVYRAKDSKLGRDVAIKVLPEEVARDQERLARFEREARLLAQLNHANVATLHGLEEHDDQQFLVMELVEGETLAERIAQGPLPVDEAIPLFIQIAEGLEAAHEKGIIHRDLKPANIKIGPDGKPKILDFGLAKVSVGHEPAPDSSQSPTLTKGTALGAIMGTASYMSPEQARGKVVDKRTDIWAFGCCFYEALTGKKVFDGETVTDTLAAVVNTEPRWSGLPANVSIRLREVIARCLTKDVSMRLRDIGEARIALAAPSSPDTSEGSMRSRRMLALAGASGLIVGAVIAIGLARPARDAEAVRPIRLSIALDEGVELPLADQRLVSISPDGARIAYVGAKNGVRHLFVRDLEGFESTLLPDTEGASDPVFSPDGSRVAFNDRDGHMRQVSVLGNSPPTKIADVGASGRGRAWSPDDTIVYQHDVGTGLYRVPIANGTPEVLTVPNGEILEKTHRYPDFLPGGRSLLMTVNYSNISSYDDADIAVLSLDTGEWTVIIDGGTDPHYVSTPRGGAIVYARGSSLMAVPFDLTTMEVRGMPVRVVDGVVTAHVWGNSQFDVSDNGALVYVPGSSEEYLSKIVWATPSGVEEPTSVDPAAFMSVRLSPDGSRLALTLGGANDDVWVYSTERGTLGRLTSGWDSFAPIWTPNGEEIIYSSTRNLEKGVGIFRKHADGRGDPEPLIYGRGLLMPCSVTPDGSKLIYTDASPDTGEDVWSLSLNGDARPEPLLQTSASERWASLSPDGRWLAYVSDESGRDEVYVTSFPEPTGRWQVSTDGGMLPVWSRDGWKLFFRQGNDVMVAVIDSPTRPGKPERALRGPYHGLDIYGWNYDISSDGRVAVIQKTERAHSELRVVLNWAEELERLVPTN